MGKTPTRGWWKTLITRVGDADVTGDAERIEILTDFLGALSHLELVCGMRRRRSGRQRRVASRCARLDVVGDDGSVTSTGKNRTTDAPGIATSTRAETIRPPSRRRRRGGRAGTLEGDRAPVTRRCCAAERGRAVCRRVREKPSSLRARSERGNTGIGDKSIQSRLWVSHARVVYSAGWTRAPSTPPIILAIIPRPSTPPYSRPRHFHSPDAAFSAFALRPPRLLHPRLRRAR